MPDTVQILTRRTKLQPMLYCKANFIKLTTAKPRYVKLLQKCLRVLEIGDQTANFALDSPYIETETQASHNT